MAASLSEFRRVGFSPIGRLGHITKLGIVGMGECVRQRIWPLLQGDAFPLDHVAVCSLEPQSALTGCPHLYQSVRPDGFLPLDYLDEHGFLSPDTLWLILTPSAYRPFYAIQLAGRCRVALDKPIASSSQQARLLLPFADGCEVYPMSHKVFTASVLAFIDDCRHDSALLRQVSHIDGVFYEAAGFSPGRQQEDSVADVQWHLFTTALIAPFSTVGLPFEVMVEQVQTATYEPDPVGHAAPATVWTASRVQGRLLGDWQEVTFDFRQAKGAPTSTKVIRLFDGAGTLMKTIDLNESGCQAHARMLLALMRPVVDMHMTLADAIAVMELIDISRKIVCEEPAYAFGSLPGFLTEEK